MNETKTVSNRHLHVELPVDIDDRFRAICPERGIRSILVRRLLLAYIKSVEEGIENIDLRKLSI